MPTAEERLASLEARVDAMADLRNLITELRGDVNSQAAGLRADIGNLRADIDRQFAGHHEETNRRFIELREDLTESRHDVNRRLAALDEKGDRHFTWMVGTQVAVLLAVVGALVGAYYR